MNRKIQFNVLVMILALTVLSLIFACYVLIRNWKWNPFYKLRATSEIVREIEMSAFGEQFPCLEYVEGLICHGKDTFEVTKFRINKEKEYKVIGKGRLRLKEVLQKKAISTVVLW